MTLKDKHQKHAALTKPQYGEFARNELAIIGTSCGLIKELVDRISGRLSSNYTIAYVDQEHKEEMVAEETELESTVVQLLEKSHFTRIDTRRPLSAFDKRSLLNKEDLVFVNGNHFLAKMQVLIIDPSKNLEKRIDRLSDVKLILLKDPGASIPDIVREKFPDWKAKPVFDLADTDKIADWIKEWMDQNTPPIKGLVLAGGESKRMQRDKGELVYHGKSQREHTLSVIKPFCSSVFLSCNRSQAEVLQGKFEVIEDTFLNLGPIGGILSAFRKDPNAAWLTVACDLPYLSDVTIQFLLAHRNPSKIATAFLDPRGVFPEPLVTLWEPRAYPVLLEYLSQGYSCPRKVLINSEVEILEAPDKKEFFNANHPDEYEQVVNELTAEKRK